MVFARLYYFFKFFTNSKRHGKDIAKTSRIAIPWIYVPVASKLGLCPQTVSPRRHISSHGMTQSFPNLLLMSFPAE